MDEEGLGATVERAWRIDFFLGLDPSIHVSFFSSLPEPLRMFVLRKEKLLSLGLGSFLDSSK